MGSGRLLINWDELKKVLKNALIFTIPLLIIVIGIIQNGGGTNEILVAVKLWLLNTLADFLRKFIADNEHKQM